MKRLLLTLATLSLAGLARATPYFRIPLVNGGNFVTIGGALLAPNNLSQSQVAGMVPLATHSPKDGCLLPQVVCEDWTPAAVGASMNAGEITFEIGPIANVLPWMQTGALELIPNEWSGIRNVLAPNPGSPVTFSAGPVWQYQQQTNKGYFRIFTGLALAW